jgi:hypothetical protein
MCRRRPECLSGERGAWDSLVVWPLGGGIGRDGNEFLCSRDARSAAEISQAPWQLAGGWRWKFDTGGI